MPRYSGSEGFPGGAPRRDEAASSRPSTGSAETKQPGVVVAPTPSSRRDAPRIAYNAGANRSSRTDGVALNRDTLLSELDADVVANSASQPLASVWRTWQSLHVAWHGTYLPVLPLTSDKI